MGVILDNLEKILELKRKKFFEIVYRCCKTEDISLPEINFGYCESEDENHLAHCHPELYKICISPRQLHKHSFEDIEETASHEVTHLIIGEHGDKFNIKHENIKIKSFDPHSFPGVISGKSIFVEKKKTKTIVNKNRCKECGKTTNLSKCDYCPHYFCLDHIKPFEPFVGHPSNRPAWMEKDEGHPDAYYVEITQKQSKIRDEEYGKVLGKLTRKESEYRFDEQDKKEFEVYSRQIKESYAPNYKPHFVEQQKFSQDVKHEKEKQSKTLQDRILKRLNRKQRKEEYKRLKREEAKRRKQIEEEKRIEQQKISKQKKEEIIKHHHFEQKQKSEEGIHGIADKARKTNQETRSPSYKHTIIDHNQNIKLAVAISFTILIAVSAIFLLNINKTPNIEVLELKENKTNITKTTYESMPAKFSFSEYINNKEKYDGKTITLTGFLRYRLDGTENVGVYNEYVVDDFNNEIKLQNIPQQYKKLFIVKETSKEIYNVTGTFRRKFRDAELEVSDIITTGRPSQMVMKKVTVQN